jgi:adenylate cyclase
MTTQESKRKLTAILSADVKGYSRLMGQDEEATVRTLKQHRLTISGLVSEHRGRVVDSPGDNILAEFGSVVDAVKCAVKIQETLKGKNAELPENRRMDFRIGVNLGDVIEEEARIYGDGVNIAARLEGLAEAGGICISGTAFDQIKNKLSVGYQYLGKQTVKNIPDPVRAYKVLMEPGAVGKVIGEKEPKQRRWGWRVVAVAVLILVAGGLIWNFYWRVPKIEPASKEKMAFPLPDKPSIAVMPFVNMSEDPKQEFFSDGITESIITALSKLNNLFVISRQSTFFYKGKPVKVKQVSEELGVQYVLEGSVQRSGDRIRINAQLIDALTGHHLWAERYERDLKDTFALQDEITLKIVNAMAVKVLKEDRLLMGGGSSEKVSLDCFMKINEGLKYNEGFNIEGNRMARRIAEEAIAMCPEVPMSYILMGFVHQMEFLLRIGKSPQESIEKGIEMAQKALALDDSTSLAHALLCSLYSNKREYDKAITEGERAVALDPSGAFAHEMYALSLNVSGRSEEAIPIYQKAIRLNPLGSPMLHVAFGNTLWRTERFEEAVSAYKTGLQRAPDNIFSHIGLAGTYSMMGREKEARAEAEEVLRLNPKLSLEFYKKAAFMYKNQDQVDRFIDALRKAGLK